MINLLYASLAILVMPAPAAGTMSVDQVRVNQTVMLGDARITPIAVLRDDRCRNEAPDGCPNVPGTLVVRLLVEQGNKTGWIDVESGRLKRWEKLAIAVAGAQPERGNGGPISSDTYRFSILRLPADVQIFE